MTMKPPRIGPCTETHGTRDARILPVTQTEVALPKALKVGGRVLSAQLIQRVWDDAAELSDSYEGKEISAQLVKRYPCLTEPVIDYVLVRLAIQFQRQAANLRTGIAAALEMAAEAGEETWAEVA